MPTASTKDRLGSDDPVEVRESRLVRARRRLAERYYDRPEVRRTVVRLLLRRFAQRPSRPGSADRETA